MDTDWRNYVFDDGDNDDDPFATFVFDAETIDKSRYPTESELKALATQVALMGIPNGHYSGRCKMCQKINISSPYGFGHHRYPGLEQSAKFGCKLCEFLFVHIKKNNSLCSADLTIDLKTSALWYKHAGFPMSIFELFTERDDETETDKSVFLRNIWTDPIEDGCIKVAQGWLDCCTREHSKCVQTTQVSSPTRLLDIRGEDVLLTQNAKNVRYAALSYCWGQNETLTTTKANITSHEKGIQFFDMPKTFQDAVTVARKLKIEFLWIDALCIVQDQEDDWAMECLRMGEYYQNAYVTISALDASDSDEGFLTIRPEIPSVRLFEDFPIHIRPQTIGRRKIFEDAALSKRGWTLQERLLSTRILHYSASEMFWECKTCSVREGSALEHCEAVDSRSLGSFEGDDFKRVLQHIDNDPHSPQNGAFVVWYRLVRQYTRRSLSRSSDKLPAISALATLFATITGFSYIVGLWADDPQGLLWLKDGKNGAPKKWTYQTRPRELQGCLAPSWSWAGTDGPIVFAPYEEERCFSPNDPKIVKHSVEPQGPTKFGSVLGGSLTLRALSKNVQCRANNTRTGSHFPLSERQRIFYMVGIPSLRYPLTIHDEVGDQFGIGVCEDLTLDNFPCECTALWIGEYNYDGATPAKAVYFLLIVPDEKEPDKWRRIGLGVTKDDPEFQGFFSTVYDNYDWRDFTLI